MTWRWARAVLANVVLACGCADDAPDDRACEGPADCDGWGCVGAPPEELDDLEPLALVCRSQPQGRAAGEACDRGAQCASGVCVLAGACADVCGDAEDCAELERCQPVYARGASERLHPVRACVAMVASGDRAAQVRVETAAASALGGGIDTLELASSNGEALFVIEHLDDESWPIPSASTGCRPPLCAVSFEPNPPDGERWFDRQQLMAAEGPINPIAIGDHVYPLTVRVPAGPRARVSESGYLLRVESKRSGRARITRIEREPESGQLDVNLYYVGTEATADAIDDALAEVDRIFEPAGVFIGERREIRVTGELLERGSDLPDAEVSRGFARLKVQYRVYPQLPELFKLSAGANNAALDVFFVAEIETGDRGVGGFAGGTPVPFGMHGTGASGVVVATDAFASDPERLGRNLAHEIGHALGLFHVVETHGAVFDPLPDTPICDLRACDNAAATNLMFPVADAQATELTPDQIDVLRRAMLLE